MEGFTTDRARNPVRRTVKDRSTTEAQRHRDSEKIFNCVILDFNENASLRLCVSVVEIRFLGF